MEPEEDLVSFDEARSRVLSGVRRLGSERVAVADAMGRVLTEDLIAAEPLPRFDNSAMDGYAVATSDLGSTGPFALDLAGESSAGKAAPWLAQGAACRIFTGAPLPERADAVVMQEYVTVDGETVRFAERPKRGQHVRRMGEDLAAEAVAIAARTRLSVGCLALASMLGRAEVSVARRPVVAIVCTGDELRSPGDESRPASIPESNSAPLTALARQAGALVRVASLVGDDPRATLRAIQHAMDGADLLLTVGGVSVGDHDVVRPALTQAGVELELWRVAIKPGKPVTFGRSARTAVLGLPGNPASAIVTFALFGMPLLRAMQGDSRPKAMLLRARLATSRRRSPDRLELVRAMLQLDGGQLAARPHDNQSSGAATSLASSDGVAFIPPGEGTIEASSFVDFLRWSDA